MFGPLKRGKQVWKYVRPNGCGTIAFNVDRLVDYMLATGDFFDPATRIPFSGGDLSEIDKLAKNISPPLSKATFGSVLEAKNNPHAYSEQKFRRDALSGLERCAGEVIAKTLEII
jgi:hypothetical protein